MGHENSIHLVFWNVVKRIWELYKSLKNLWRMRRCGSKIGSKYEHERDRLQDSLKKILLVHLAEIGFLLADRALTLTRRKGFQCKLALLDSAVIHYEVSKF